MSKSNKNDKDLFGFDLEEFLEEQLKDYLEDREATFFANPHPDDSIINEASKSGGTGTGSGDLYYDSLMEVYIKDLVYLTANIKPSKYQAISGSGPAWFFEPGTKSFIKTQRGAPVVVIPGEEDNMGRLLVRTMNTFIMVPKEEILDLGYN
tara:strand:- start:582 stop:1034 length:453 start_codon:yes stop_codon:yes gene_type:complete